MGCTCGPNGISSAKLITAMSLNRAPESGGKRDRAETGPTAVSPTKMKSNNQRIPSRYIAVNYSYNKLYTARYLIMDESLERKLKK